MSDTLSNTELVAAIAEAWKLTRTTGTGEAAYPILVQHLKILLEAQQARAKATPLTLATL